MGKLDFSISLKLLSENFKKGINNVKSQLNSLKGWIASAFAVGSILDFTKSIASVGSAFQDQMARVKAVSGATKEEFKAMTDEAKRLGSVTKYSAQEAAQALENLTRNGLKAKDATEALSHVLKLAGSQAIELAQAADIATTIINAFGLEIKDLEKVNDILASTTANSATNVSELAEALKVAAPIAKTLGLDLTETNAALGTLANVGYKGSQAGTALRIILSRIAKQTPQAEKVLKSYGLTLTEADLRADKLEKTLQRLAGVKMNFADLTTVFGQEAAAPIAALLNNLKSFQGLKINLENSEGESDRQYREGVGEFKNAVDELSSSWESFLNGIFDKTSGVFTGIINGAKSVVEQLKKWSTWIAAGFAAVGIAVAKKYEAIKKVSTANINKGKAEATANAGLKEFVYSAESVLENKNAGKNKNGIYTTQAITKTTNAYERLKNIIESIEGLDSKRKKKLEESVEDAKEFAESFKRAKKYTEELINAYDEISRVEGDLKTYNKARNTETDPALIKEYNDLYQDAKLSLERLSKEYDEYREKLSKEIELQYDLQEVISKNAGLRYEEIRGLDQDKIDEELKKSTEELEKQNSLGKNLEDTFKDLGGTIANSLKSLYNSLGGIWGILSTIASIAGKAIYDYIQEQNKAFKEIKESYKEIETSMISMESRVISLVNVMEKSGKGTTAYKQALQKLTQEYPELFKQMNLEQELARKSGEEYDKLKEKIKGVIKEQRDYLLQEHKRESIEKLQKDFQEKTSSIGKDLVQRFTPGAGSKEAAEIIVHQIRSDISTILEEGFAKGLERSKIEANIEEYLREQFKRFNVAETDNLTVHGGLDAQPYSVEYDVPKDLAKTFYNKYRRYGSAIESINKLETGEAKPTPDIIAEVVKEALNLANSRAADIKATEKAKGRTNEEIKSTIISSNAEILNELVDRLYNMKLENGQDALAYAQGLKDYKTLLKSSIQPTTGGGGGGSTKDQTPKQLFDETKKYIDALKDAGIIKEKEYRERLLSAYDSYISGLESEKKTDKKSIRTLNDLIKTRDKLKKEVDDAAKAEEHWKEITDLHARIKEELAQKDKERLDESDSISKSIDNAKYRNSKYSPYKWDMFFNANNGFEGSQILDEQKLAQLESYLSSLESIAGDKIDIDLRLKDLEGLKGEGVDALRKELEKLRDILIDLEDQTKNLDDKIQFKRARKELDDLQKNNWKDGYEGVKLYFNNITSLGNAFHNLKEQWKEMSDTEQVLAVMDSFFNTVDSIWQMVDAWNALADLIEVYKYKKQILTSLENKDNATKIALTQAEAAAVVEAEALKTGAISASIAEQTALMLAAKTAQTKAATVAMAAESAAAFAGIPFAGPALAAAQIAEFEALIAAAAALPMFAEGGIVGGTKYTGDQNLARVNSGEMIINRGQQKKLWDAISGGKYGSNNSLSGDVEFKISGQVLRGVLNNHDKKMSKIKG